MGGLLHADAALATGPVAEVDDDPVGFRRHQCGVDGDQLRVGLGRDDPGHPSATRDRTRRKASQGRRIARLSGETAPFRRLE